MCVGAFMFLSSQYYRDYYLRGSTRVQICWSVYNPTDVGAVVDIVLCCSRGRDFKLDLQLSRGKIKGEEADLESKRR